MAARFYNPGSRLYEKMAFDHPTNDIKNQNLISYFQIDAPEKSFFDVPSEVEVETVNGPMSVSVKFAERLQKDYKEYGLIRIDKKRNLIGEDENVASDERDAKIKGERMWRDYLVAKAREHIQNVDQCHASGVVPLRAKGIYAHALKTLGMEDPADKVGSLVGRTQDDERVKKLESELAELRALITKGK